MIRNREEAAQAAEATVSNIPGFCQGQTRAWFLSPSVGDVDHDGASDAEDGWKSEPEEFKHVGDRNPPRGVPISFLGGRNDNGHRAMSLGDSRFRSTDFDSDTQSFRSGVVGTATSIGALERAMGVTYAGWSETIGGELIPIPEGPLTRGKRVDSAIIEIREARDISRDGTKRDSQLRLALRALRKIVPWHKRVR